MPLSNHQLLPGMSLMGFFRMTSRAVGTTDPQPQPIYGGQRGWYNILETLRQGLSLMRKLCR